MSGGACLDADGRLFKMRLDLNRDARAAALASIRDAEFGYVHARIGGPQRGKDELFASRCEAERAVNRHYDAAMMRHVTRGRAT